MKKIAFILALIVLTMSLGCGVSTAFATTEIAFDNTYVLDDLNESNIVGEQFNLIYYGYSKERQARVLTFAEYGFNYDSDKQNYYGLYVYVYNPSGQTIGKERNKITIATVYENGKAVNYDPFELILLSVSEGDYANLFYKFKVADVSNILTLVSVNTNLRRYDVGEIELNFGDANSEAFDVGNYYEYSGFAKGCGVDTTADSTLTCKSDGIETLKLDVRSTYYRYNNGVTTQSNLSSVYFGVPTATLETYGKLHQIKANWFETKTQPMIVLGKENFKEMYDALLPYAGISTNDKAVDVSKLPLGTLNKLDKFTCSAFGFMYDGKYHDNIRYNEQYNYFNKFYWLFCANTGSSVSSDEILKYAKDYTEKFSNELLLDKYSKELFVQSVDEKRQYGWQGDDGKGIVIDADSTFNIDGFTTGNALRDWFWKMLYDFDESPLTDLEPIKVVADNDLKGDNATIAKRLLIDEDDVDDFKLTYNQNKVMGKKTVLFRFALTDYKVDTFNGNYETFLTGYNTPIGYMAQETVFLDFDVIWLEFVKEGVETVIPTVSSPIDVVGGLTPKPAPTDPFEWLKNFVEWLKEYWWVILAGLGVVLLIVLLAVDVLRKGLWITLKAIGKGIWYFIKYLFIGLYYILASPVYLIAWIVRKIKDR